MIIIIYLPSSSINGVKDMKGYRQALNLSYQLPTLFGDNSSDVESCDSQDDVDTSAILASECLLVDRK